MLSHRLDRLLQTMDLPTLARRLGTGPTVIPIALRGVSVAPAIRAALEARLPSVEFESGMGVAWQ